MTQAVLVPTQQQGTAVHRLRSRRIVIEDQDLDPLSHGTIVP